MQCYVSAVWFIRIDLFEGEVWLSRLFKVFVSMFGDSFKFVVIATVLVCCFSWARACCWNMQYWLRSFQVLILYILH